MAQVQVLLVVAQNWPLPRQAALCYRLLSLWVEHPSAPLLLELSGGQGYLVLNHWEVDSFSATWQPGLGYLVDPDTYVV